MTEETFLDSLDNIPPRLISELRRMSQEHMDPNMTDDPSLDFDPQTDRHSRAAMKILSGLPMAGGAMTGPETILFLVRNPEYQENQVYVRKNRALLRAFPILKQIYGIEKESSLLDWKEFDKQTKERNLAIEDFIDMFGKDALPKEFQLSLENINKRIRELDPKVLEEAKWLEAARLEMGRGDAGGFSDRVSTREREKMIGSYTQDVPITPPLEADAETVKHIKNQEKLQKEIDRLAGSPYVQDATGTEPVKEKHKLRKEMFHDNGEVTGQGSATHETEEEKAPFIGTTGVSGVGSSIKLKRGYEPPPVSLVSRGSATNDLEEVDHEREAQIGADELEVDADKAEDAYELPETDLESGRNAYTIEKDVAITEALEAADYEKVKRIEDAYKNHEPIPTDDTDDWSYMGKAMHRYQEGGIVGYAHGGSAEKQLTEPVIPHPDVTLDTSLPTENVGFVGTPNGAADDQTEAAKNGKMGGDKVDENLPEGSFVLNSYAVELAGIKDIEKLIDDAKKYMLVQTGESGFVSPTGEDVEVRVSEGEYIIPPSLVRIIGRDRLEKINNRGIVEFERQQAEETEMGGEEMPQEPRGFMPQEEAAPMPPEGGAPMPPEGGAPMPPQDTAPMPPEQVPQGFALGGGVSQDRPKVDVYEFLNALGPVLGKGAKPATAPKQQKVAQVAKPKVGGPRIGGRPGQPVPPARPGQLQRPKGLPMGGVGVNMGGFIPYSRNG